jgi:nucleotide-binding universal stress UspA family protein
VFAVWRHLECAVHSISTMEFKEPQRILIPTDFSECSDLGLDYGAVLARRLGASVHVVYASEVPKELVGDFIGDRKNFVDADIRNGRTQIERALARLREQGVSCTGEVVPGYPGYPEDLILEYAKSGNYDLVVIGTHGRTGFKRRWIGSVAECISRNSPIPVVMVRLPRSEADVRCIERDRSQPR